MAKLAGWAVSALDTTRHAYLPKEDINLILKYLCEHISFVHGPKRHTLQMMLLKAY